MSKGKKITPELVYKIMASYAVTGNFKQTSRDLDVPYTTVRETYLANKDKPEYVKLSDETKESFADSATKLIDKGLLLLNRRFDRAIEQEESLDVLIDEIFASSREEITQDEKLRLVNKIKQLQLQDTKAITTAIGTLFDKRALAQGQSTDNVSVIIKLPEGVDEYAG